MHITASDLHLYMCTGTMTGALPAAQEAFPPVGAMANLAKPCSKSISIHIYIYKMYPNIYPYLYLPSINIHTPK